MTWNMLKYKNSSTSVETNILLHLFRVCSSLMCISALSYLKWYFYVRFDFNKQTQSTLFELLKIVKKTYSIHYEMSVIVPVIWVYKPHNWALRKKFIFLCSYFPHKANFSSISMLYLEACVYLVYTWPI